MAEALFNQISKNYKATSAGTEKGRVTNHKLKDFPEHSNLFICMDEVGIDLRNKVAKLLTQKMIKDADKIVVMAEKETWPDYLKKSNKVVFWNIEDPCNKSLDTFIKVRNKIKKKIEELI